MAEKIGLEAVWNNAGFNKGQAEYMSKMQQAQGMTGAAVGQMGQMGQAAGGLGGMFGQLAGMLGMSTGGMLALGGAVALGVGAFKAITGAVSSFVDFMVKGSDSAIMVASRVEQLNLIAQTLAQRQGMAGEAVNELVGQLNKLGISLNVSNYLVAQFARMQLNLAQSTELARVAQDAATISNEGSSDALEGLIYGIQTLNIRILRTHGILVDTDIAYAKYGETIGKTADSLSTAEKQQAMLNEVIAQGATVAGAYEASMMTAGKQLGSMTSRVLPDLKAALGAPFQGAFYNVVKGINDVLDAFRSMVVEGGVLYPVMVQLGAVFQILTEPIRAFGAALKETEGGPLASFANTLSNFIANAASYGANLVTNFAVGMINAASNILVAAINYIANLLTSWFAPGSPPAVAPEIDIWGMETMEEYLEGFTEADFNIIKNVQRPMQQVFGTLADMGAISKEAAYTMYNEFSQEFIAAMASGEVTQAMFDELAAAGGEFGGKLAEVAKAQYDLATATQAVKDAEQELTDAKKRSTTAGAAVNKGIAEYNAMLRGGASKEALDAKLAEIDANKQAKIQADEDVKAAEEKKTAAEEALKIQQEQAALLEQQLQMMLDLAKAQIDAAKAAEAAKKAAEQPPTGGGGGNIPTLPEGGLGGGGFDPNKIVNPLRDAVNAAVEAMKQKFRDAWENIKSTVSAKWNEAMQRVREAWDGLVKAFMGTKFGQWLSGIWTSISTWFQNLPQAWANFKEAWGTFWGGIGTTAGTIWSTITGTIGGWIEAIKSEIQAFIAMVQQWWSDHGENIKFVIGFAWNAITTVIRTALAIINAYWTAFVAVFTPYFQALWTTISTIFTNVWTAISTYASNIWNAIVTIATTVWNSILAMFTNIWNLIKANFQLALDQIGVIFDFFASLLRGDWEGMWTAIQTYVTNALTMISNILSTAWENIKIVIETVWAIIKTTIETVWANIKVAVETSINNVKAVIEGVMAAISGVWAVVWGAISTVLSNIWTAIQTAVSTAITAVSTTISTIMTSLEAAWTTTWTSISTTVSSIWTSITSAVTTAAQAVYDAATQWISDAWDTLSGYVDSFYSLGSDLIGGMIDGVMGAVQGAINSVVSAIQSIINAAKGVLGADSPSKVFAGLGLATMQGMEIGINQNAKLPERAMTTATIGTISSAAVPITTGTTNNYYQPSISMHNQINNGMDAAILEASVKRIVQKELRKV